MASNGHKYDLTEDLGVWKDNDLINYVLDTEGIMGLEKFEIARLAQELARRYDAYVVPWDEGDVADGEFNE